jgi:hypothetical protein
MREGEKQREPGRDRKDKRGETERQRQREYPRKNKRVQRKGKETSREMF